MSTISFSEDAARTLVMIYSTPDLVAQREATTQQLALKPGERVIDVGCGPGFLCESMAADVGATGHVLGVDVSEDLICFAADRRSRTCIDYRAGNASALEVSSASFDAFVSAQVIEYVPDPDAALRELYRVLRPGGRGLIVDTDWDSVLWHSSDAERMARVLAAWENHCAHPRLPRTFAPRLRASGFVVNRVEGYPIVNITYDPNTYSHGLARLISEYLSEWNFDARALADWRANLSALGEGGFYFFSINRYFFALSKPNAVGD